MIDKQNEGYNVQFRRQQMAKKSDRVLRRELRKAEKRFKNSNRIKPKVVARDPKAVPINQIITLDYLTNPQSDK